MSANRRLVLLKLTHTVVWAVFAGCILAIPLATARGDFTRAWTFAAIVFGEVLILAFNRWSCPLTGVAARYTTDRSDNFDIYLPLWLARYNKTLFGTLYVVALIYLAWAWLAGSSIH
ncbi:MAG: hypothetical protein H6978_14770 [Gammaproteobacteria bacterium]|nr:hypothetical protein [Gammaproteobacteria bacterium]